MADKLKRLGRYDLQRVLGEGAMGVVYEALDPKLHRTVAIKTILTNRLDSETAVQYSHRFMREAQAVARLNHPGIVQIHDFGEEGEVAYIVMEYVRGRELGSYFNGNERFEVNEAVRIMTELLDALEFAHQAGIVHRDIKPANVMIDQHRRVKLTDFGVARVTEAEQTMAERAGVERTQAGAVIGTPAYMSPEQITGEAVDHRTDIFSAGIIFYQLLTGEKPFGGTGGWTIAKKIVQDDPPLPSTINVTVPAQFDHVVRKALAKRASDRFQSAREFAAALNLAVGGKVGEPSADATVLGPDARAAMAQPHSTATSPKTQPFVPSTTPPAKPAPAKAPTSPGTQEVELEFWRAIKDGNDPEDFELYIQQFPAGIYANLARRKIAKLRGLETSDTNHPRLGAADLGLNSDEQARRQAEDRRRKEVDERLAKDSAERRAREEAERRQREEAVRREAEAKEKQRLAEEAAARQKLAEEKARLESELLKREEDFRKREAEAEAKRAVELRARTSAEEKARLDAIERAKREAAAEMAKREADYQRREAELMARSTAEEKVRLVAIEKARLEAIEKAKQEAAAEIARREADYQRREAELMARSTAEEKARLLAIEKARLEAIEKAKLEAAVELAKRDAEYKKREAESAAKAEAAARARREADEQAKREADLRARQEAELKAKREAEYQKREAELKKREADEKVRREAAERARKEAEERMQRVQRAMDMPAGSAGTAQPAPAQAAPLARRKTLVAFVAAGALVAAAGAIYWAQMPGAPQDAPSVRPTQADAKPESGPAPVATQPVVPPPVESGDASRGTAAPVASVQDSAEEKARSEAVARREAEEKAKQAAVLKSRKEAEANQKRELAERETRAVQEKVKLEADEAMAAELAFWNKTKSSTNLADYDAYLQRYPNGHFVALAKNARDSLVRHQQEAKDLAAQRARLDEESRKAKEQEARRQAEAREREEKQKAEAKDAPRKSGVFVAPTF